MINLDTGTVDTALETYAIDIAKGIGLAGVVPIDYDAKIPFPYGVAADFSNASAGVLYTSSHKFHYVRRTDLQSGISTTFVGTGVQGSSGDDGPASSSALD